MNAKYFCLILIGTIFLIPSIAIALPANQTLQISAETGETYIQWSWKTTNSSIGIPPVNIYIDDSQTPIITGYMSTTYLCDHLSEGSRHNIVIHNATAESLNETVILGKASALTLNPGYEVYYLVSVCIFLMIVCFFLADLVRLILMSIVNIVLCLFGISMATGRGPIPYMFIAIAIITVIILLVNGLPKVREELAWF